MNTQIIQDQNGKPAGVFIPISDWNRIKSQYPDIENAYELPDWEKKIIDERLDAIAQNSDRLKPLNELLKEL